MESHTPKSGRAENMAFSIGWWTMTKLALVLLFACNSAQERIDNLSGPNPNCKPGDSLSSGFQVQYNREDIFKSNPFFQCKKLDRYTADSKYIDVFKEVCLGNPTDYFVRQYEATQYAKKGSNNQKEADKNNRFLASRGIELKRPRRVLTDRGVLFETNRPDLSIVVSTEREFADGEKFYSVYHHPSAMNADSLSRLLGDCSNDWAEFATRIERSLKAGQCTQIISEVLPFTWGMGVPEAKAWVDDCDAQILSKAASVDRNLAEIALYTKMRLERPALEHIHVISYDGRLVNNGDDNKNKIRFNEHARLSREAFLAEITGNIAKAGGGVLTDAISSYMLESMAVGMRRSDGVAYVKRGAPAVFYSQEMAVIREKHAATVRAALSDILPSSDTAELAPYLVLEDAPLVRFGWHTGSPTNLKILFSIAEVAIKSDTKPITYSTYEYSRNPKYTSWERDFNAASANMHGLQAQCKKVPKYRSSNSGPRQWTFSTHTVIEYGGSGRGDTETVESCPPEYREATERYFKLKASEPRKEDANPKMVSSQRTTHTLSAQGVLQVAFADGSKKTIQITTQRQAYEYPNETVRLYDRRAPQRYNEVSEKEACRRDLLPKLREATLKAVAQYQLARIKRLKNKRDQAIAGYLLGYLKSTDVNEVRFLEFDLEGKIP